jgi:ABC-2 type transport system ATP-binding protein
MSGIIEVRDLHKSFGELRAVDGISFTVEKGEIFGFLGPNGAGKTTTMRLVTGVLRPDSGSCVLAGFDIQKRAIEAQRRIGIAPEVSNAYVELTAWQNMMLMGEIYGVRRTEREFQGKELLQFFDLETRKDSRVKEFSKGMRRRLTLAMSMMHQPSILFLDEPTSGLDVKSQRLIKNRMQELNEQGVTIFLTTHNMWEANELCDRIAVMNKGKIAAIDRPETLKRSMESTQMVEVSFSGEGVDTEILAQMRGVERVERSGDAYRLITHAPVHLVRIILDMAEERGLEVLQIQTLGPSLEEVFLQLTEGAA